MINLDELTPESKYWEGSNDDDAIHITYRGVLEEIRDDNESSVTNIGYPKVTMNAYDVSDSHKIESNDIIKLIRNGYLNPVMEFAEDKIVISFELTELALQELGK